MVCCSRISPIAGSKLLAQTINMASLIPTSFIYYTMVDYNHRPKPVLGSLIGATFMAFHNTYEYNISSSCVLTVIFIEVLLRLVCLILLLGL